MGQNSEEVATNDLEAEKPQKAPFDTKVQKAWSGQKVRENRDFRKYQTYFGWRRCLIETIFGINREEKVNLCQVRALSCCNGFAPLWTMF